MKMTNIFASSFEGMAIKAPMRKIRNAQDAIEQWKVLKHPQYTTIFQEEEIVTNIDILENKSIRNRNSLNILNK